MVSGSRPMSAQSDRNTAVLCSSSPSAYVGMVALASGFTFALLIVGMRLAREEGPVALALGNLVAAAITLPFWGLGPTPRASDLGLLAYLGVFQLGLAYVCFGRGVAHVGALETSLLVLLEPVLNPIWTFLVAGERPGPWALAGGAVVLIATVWRTLASAVAALGSRPDRSDSTAAQAGRLN